MEIGSAPLPPEFQERINSARKIVVDANSYGTRSIVPIEISGQTRSWHSVKGGIEAGKTTIGPAYEIFFDPETNEWLKIRAPKSEKGTSTILDRSADIMAASLKLAGFDDLADKIVKCTVGIRGRETNGFISPHVGPSLETLIRMYREAKRTMGQAELRGYERDARQFFSNAYAAALDQSIRLYLQHGYWTHDANPGNILFRENDQGELKTINIDFVAKLQVRQQAGVFEYVNQLYQLFKTHAIKHNITFPFETEDYRHLCSVDRPGKFVPASSRSSL
jgi:hypothetical protein